MLNVAFAGGSASSTGILPAPDRSFGGAIPRGCGLRRREDGVGMLGRLPGMAFGGAGQETGGGKRQERTGRTAPVDAGAPAPETGGAPEGGLEKWQMERIE